MKSLITLLFILTTFLYANIAKVTAISGEAIVIRDKNEISIKKNFEIYEKDIIKTMKNAKLQLIFKDKTMISLGQKSTFEIEKYLFSNKKPVAKFKISKGLFKSITGKIGKIAPKNFQLKTQNATIGIRGTTIIAEVSKESDTIICSSGQIVVSTPKGEVIVNKGEKTIAQKLKPPTKAIKVTKKSIQQLEKKVDAKAEKPTSKEVEKKAKTKKEKEKKKTTTEKKKNENEKNEKNTNEKTTKTTEKKRTKVEKTITKKIAKIITPLPPVIKKELPKLDNQIKDRWGDWNKEKFFKDEAKKLPPKKPTPTPKKQMLKNLEELRLRAGQIKPTYEGKVDGFVNQQYKISDQNNHIKLNFDLGSGKVDGNMEFYANKEQWSADIKNGTIDQRGKFDFKLKGTNSKGVGDGVLSGKKLENANGSFMLENGKNQQAFGTFSAKKK